MHHVHHNNNNNNNDSNKSQINATNYPVSGISHPGQNDVMCGRGGGTNNHIGNIRFRQLVNEYKLRYLAAPKVEKPKVAMLVVQVWRQLDPPGRFLTKTDSKQGDNSPWHDVGDKKAREKASQCLRERTPEAKSFVQNLKENEGIKHTENKTRAGSANPSKSAKRPPKKHDHSATTTRRHDESISLALQTKVSATETITSAATSKNAMSTTTPLSIQTPDITVSSSASNSEDLGDPGCREQKNRDQIGNKIPTAAALMSNIFEDDDDDNDTFSFEDFQSRPHGFLDLAPKHQNDNNDECSMDRSLMDGDSKDWVKSFESIGSASINMLLSVANSSLQGDSGMPPPESVPKQHDAGSRSSLRSKSKTTNHAASSNMSVTSELTDLSAGLKDMGLDKT